MAMMLVVLGLVLILASTGCFLFVLRHAFQRSLGTGVMVLCIPFYQVVYGFSQFEHRRKGPILAGWMGGLVLGIVLRLLGLVMGASAGLLPQD
jgi:benzodiazapine receptor